MIEFKGTLCGRSKRFIIVNQVKGQLLAVLIAAVIFATPVVVGSILDKWNMISTLVVTAFCVMLIISLIPPGKQAQRGFVPKRIFIDLEERTLVHECEEQERFHMIDSVKTVVDYGEWYHIKFYYQDRDPYFVCQKSLLSQGTIEEFEALFDGKIVRHERV